MATWNEKEIVCGCCGAHFQATLLQSMFTPKNSISLDLNPHNASGYGKAVLCPHCGYSSDAIEEKADRMTTAIVKSSKYQEICKLKMDEIYKKNCLAAIISQAKNDFRSASSFYLSCAWYLESIDKSSVKIRKQACECLEKYLEQNADLDSAIQLLDCQRRLGDFTEALDTALFLSRFAEGFQKDIVLFEQELITKHDSNEHYLSEVRK